MLVAEGEAGLTMSAVAAEADVAVGGLYRYFDSKDALLAALQIRAVTRFGAVLDDALDGLPEARPLARIHATARAWFTFADSHPAEFELLDKSLSDPRQNLDDDGALAVDQALRPVFGRVVEELERAVAADELTAGDPVLRARVLWATVHGAAHFRKRDRLGGPTASDVLDEGVRALVRGWHPT